MSELKVEVEGLQELLEKLRDKPKLFGNPFQRTMKAIVLDVEKEAKDRVPRWRHNLLRAISHQVEPSPVPLWAKAGVIGAKGSPLYKQAATMEFGRRAGAKPPPTRAIEPWARAKGLNPYLVARSIGRKGIKPRRYLRGAWDAVKPRIPDYLKRAAALIETEWGRKP